MTTLSNTSAGSATLPRTIPAQRTSRSAVLPEERAAWETRLMVLTVTVGRLALAYLFFTQLFWKLPPNFGCPDDFRFTTANAQGQLVRSAGLCDWIGIESVWAQRPRPLLVADLPGAKVAIDIAPIAQMNGAIIDNVIKPNLRWFGYIIWLSEAFIVVSLALGLLSRLGGVVALAVSGQLMVGLAGISNPYEWEWGYNQMVVLSILMIGLAPGRWFGFDGAWRPRLLAAAANGNRLARLVSALT